MITYSDSGNSADTTYNIIIYNSITNNLDDEKRDTESPFSFLDFLKYSGTNDKNINELELYNDYLKDWESTSTLTLTSLNVNVRNQFIAFLSQIKLVFLTPEEQRFFDNIDLNNNEQLTIAVPFFSKKIKEIVSNKNKITIIGGGFIGLEIASSLSQLQKKVIVIEIGNQLMGRIIPKQIADLVQNTHIEHGNEIILNKQIEKITKKNGDYEILLNDNSLIETDFIIAGIGSTPTVKLFENTNLKLDNGIVTNQFCETSIKDVYAAGDVSNFYHPFYERNMRLESYQHAQNHGICAGKNIAGVKTEYTSIPWMWSDQFNLNLQLTGICDEYDEIIERGNDINNGVIYFFLKNNKIRGACGVGIIGKVGRDIRITSKLTEKDTIVDKQILSDQNLKLNKLIQK